MISATGRKPCSSDCKLGLIVRAQGLGSRPRDPGSVSGKFSPLGSCCSSLTASIWRSTGMILRMAPSRSWSSHSLAAVFSCTALLLVGRRRFRRLRRLCFENVSTQVKKRLLIFGLLGPALGFLVLWVLIRTSAGSATKDIWIAIPAVYAFELMPFCVCALVDLHLENQARWERFAAVAATGFVTSCAVLAHARFSRNEAIRYPIRISWGDPCGRLLCGRAFEIPSS